jgi:hypothetical protein
VSRVSRTDALGVVAPCDAPDEGAADHLARNLSEDPRYVGTFAAPDVRSLVNHLRASPLYQRDPLLRAAVERIALGDDPLRTLGAAVLAFAEERARLLKMATAAAISGPVILAPVDAFAAPAHNPGARVVATGGGR